MTKRRSKQQRRLITVFIAAFLLFCLIIELGQLVPSLGIPSWDALFTSAGFSGQSVTAEGELQVHFIDVGNADSILIRQGEVSALIDAGERGDGDKIYEYLRKQGVNELDLVVATHPHADHIGGMTKIIENMPVGTFLMSFMPPENTPTSSTYLSMLEALDDKNIPVKEATPDAVYTIGTAQLTVLAPLEPSDNANNISVVTRLTFGQRCFLFTGDAETAVEKAILTSGRTVKADVLKVGHHGSNTSSSLAWLKRVAPSYAVVPCGVGNSYGHPHVEVLERLEELGTSVLRADVAGHIVFTSDGKSLTVSTQK